MAGTAKDNTAAERLLEVLNGADRPLAVRELAQQARVSPASASAQLARMVAANQVSRLGRGIFAAGRGRGESSAPRLTEGAQRLVSTLRHGQIGFQLSGYDIVSGFANQLPATWPPHLLYVDPGAGEWAADLLQAERFPVLVEPKRQQLETASELTPEHLVIVRERSLEERSKELQSAPLAWVDLVAESRGGYPVSASELGEILWALSESEQVSWTAVARAGRRRGLPFTVEPGPRIPLRLDRDPQGAEWLRSVLER